MQEGFSVSCLGIIVKKGTRAVAPLCPFFPTQLMHVMHTIYTICSICIVSCRQSKSHHLGFGNLCNLIRENNTKLGIPVSTATMIGPPSLPLPASAAYIFTHYGPISRTTHVLVFSSGIAYRLTLRHELLKKALPHPEKQVSVITFST